MKKPMVIVTSVGLFVTIEFDPASLAKAKDTYPAVIFNNDLTMRLEMKDTVDEINAVESATEITAKRIREINFIPFMAAEETDRIYISSADVLAWYYSAKVDNADGMMKALADIDKIKEDLNTVVYQKPKPDSRLVVPGGMVTQPMRPPNGR